MSYFIDLKYLVRLSTFLLLLILDINVFPEPLNIHPFYLPNKKPILYLDTNKTNILQSGRKYLDKCIT